MSDSGEPMVVNLLPPTPAESPAASYSDVHASGSTQESLTLLPSPSPVVSAASSTVSVNTAGLSSDFFEPQEGIEKQSTTSIKEDQLSEEELRRLYDDEEIDRFLVLFADVRDHHL